MGDALKEWKLSIFNIVDKHIQFVACVHIILVRFRLLSGLVLGISCSLG